MLDRDDVEEFLDCKLTELEIEIPKDISKEQLVEAFCQYVEDDYYEWLKDNFKSFFDHGEPDWEWIRDRVRVRA
jgi:biotin-(acetyl-CoA carboxylase) ligase